MTTSALHPPASRARRVGGALLLSVWIAVPFALAMGASESPPPAPAPPAASEADPWQPFGEAPFLRAQSLNRPVLLAVTVRWNRQAVRFMDEVLGRADVGAVLRDRYVAILVDGDLRPDLHDRYGTGAWPSVSILTPIGDPLFSRPREKEARPRRIGLEGVPLDRLAEFLRQTADYYRTLVASGGDEGFLRSALAAELRDEAGKYKKLLADRDSIRTAAGILRSSADMVHGGFGRAPKTLLAEAIQASLYLGRDEGDATLSEVGRRALEAGAALIDPVDGGVYRMAAEQSWKGIQYERLLSRNAEALEAYSAGHAVTGAAVSLERARRIAGYIQSALGLPDGGFAHAQAADLASADGERYFRASAEERARLGAPPVIRTVVASSTARAARALLRFSALTGDPAPRSRALRALDFLDGRLYTPGRGIRHAWEGGASVDQVLLEDQIHYAEAQLEAHFQTGEDWRLERALDVARFTRDNLRDPGQGLFHDTLVLRGGPSLMQVGLKPFDANCAAARLFARLHYLRRHEGAVPVDRDADGTAEGMAHGPVPNWQEIAERLLDLLVSRLPEAGTRAGSYALAAAEYFESPVWAFLVGDPGADRARRLLDAVYRLGARSQMVVVLDPATEMQEIIQRGMARGVVPAVTLSQEGTATPPSILPEMVAPAYRKLREAVEAARKATADGAPAAKGSAE